MVENNKNSEQITKELQESYYELYKFGISMSILLGIIGIIVSDNLILYWLPTILMIMIKV